METKLDDCPLAVIGRSQHLSADLNLRQCGDASPDAMDACMAMKPEERPMSLTRPTPRLADRASIFAAISAVCARSTDVSNPKHLSICARRTQESAAARVYSFGTKSQ